MNPRLSLVLSTGQVQAEVDACVRFPLFIRRYLQPGINPMQNRRFYSVMKFILGISNGYSLFSNVVLSKDQTVCGQIDGLTFRRRDIKLTDILRTDFLPKGILPKGDFAVRHSDKRTSFRKTVHSSANYPFRHFVLRPNWLFDQLSVGKICLIHGYLYQLVQLN